MAMQNSEDVVPALEPIEPEVVSGLKPYEILFEIAHSVPSQKDLAELFRLLFLRLKETGKFDVLSLILHDAISNVMRLSVSQGPSLAAFPELLETPVADSPAGWVSCNQPYSSCSPALLCEVNKTPVCEACQGNCSGEGEK
jgi:hypothetical protein